MYQQECEAFYAQFPYGVGCPVGSIEGQPGRMFFCSVPSDNPNIPQALQDGRSFYAGKVDDELMLVVSEHEIQRAYRSVGQPRLIDESGNYNPNNTGLLVENVNYWLKS